MRLFLIIASLAAASSALAQNDAAHAINSFGLDLLRRGGGSTENALLSPYSIETALSMPYMGAEGQTRSQMARVMRYRTENTDQQIARLGRDLQEMVNKAARVSASQNPSQTEPAAAPIILNVPNRLFGQKDYNFRAEFLSALQDYFNAPMVEMNFVDDPAGAATAINKWIAHETSNRIKDLLPGNAVDALTRLILVNAVYLKAPWEEQFSESATKPASFTLATGKLVDIPTMNLPNSPLGYAKREGFTAVSLPFLGGDLHFLILMPDKADALPALEAGLTAETLADLANIESQPLNLFLPKFNLTPPTLQLTDLLMELGMTNAFDDPPGSANFDGIAIPDREGPIFITDVFHKAFIEIDERGTEAAAATAVVMGLRSAPIQEPAEPLEVRVDRPFLFAIQHRASGACLFLGRMMDPTAIPR